MLDFPFQQEKRAFVADWKARNQGWWNTGFPALSLFPISGCGNLFWIQLQVENQSLAEQPVRPSCQSPKCAAETLALWRWSWGCLPKICAAVKVAVMGLWLASALHFGSDLETCQLKQLSWFFVYCPCSMSRKLKGGAQLLWLCHSQGLASSNCGAQLSQCLPPTGHGGSSGVLSVAGCLFHLWLGSQSLGSKWLCLSISPCTDRLHVGTCLAALRRDAQWQLMILGGRGARGASSVPKLWIRLLEGMDFFGKWRSSEMSRARERNLFETSSHSEWQVHFENSSTSPCPHPVLSLLSGFIIIF